MAVKTYNYQDETQLSAHFNVQEFRCKCGQKHDILIADELVTKLETLFTKLNCSKIVITSGYRCSAHDRTVGGSGTGQHVNGNAADICCYGQDGQPISSKLVCCAAQDIGFGGIANITKAYIYTHVDVRTDSKWFGDETVNYHTLTNDFYKYFGISQNVTEANIMANTNEAVIWNKLISVGMTKEGAAGLMGNLYAESALNPQNLQNSYEKSLGYSDADYTAAVDSGKYLNFSGDSAGYGLAQWTYSVRKKNLLAFAKARGCSVGDLDMQLDFLLKELAEDYAPVLRVLQSAQSVRTASDAVMVRFENPADQSEAAKQKRTSFGLKYLEQFKNTPTHSFSPDKSVLELAQEVLSGLWGVGEERRQRLTAAGYDYAAVQTEVNRLVAQDNVPVPAFDSPDGGTLSIGGKTYRITLTEV